MDSDLRPGCTFGHFEVLAEIGAGGMGRVYHARDPVLDRSVALKVLSEEVLRDEDSLQRFMREARSVAKFDHPNVVRIYEFGQEQGLYYLAMEFVDGSSVGNHLDTGKVFSETE